MPVIAAPKSLDELNQLHKDERLLMVDAIALRFAHDDIEKGRQILTNIKSTERARIKQREISCTTHQLLWLAIAAVGGHQLWLNGYWPFSIIVAAIWTFTSVQMFWSIRAEYNSRFAEIIFAAETDQVANIRTITVQLFRTYIDDQTQQASSPLNILEFGEHHYAPAALVKRK